MVPLLIGLSSCALYIYIDTNIHYYKYLTKSIVFNVVETVTSSLITINANVTSTLLKK